MTLLGLSGAPSVLTSTCFRAVCNSHLNSERLDARSLCLTSDAVAANGSFETAVTFVDFGATFTIVQYLLYYETLCLFTFSPAWACRSRLLLVDCSRLTPVNISTLGQSIMNVISGGGKNDFPKPATKQSQRGKKDAIDVLYCIYSALKKLRKMVCVGQRCTVCRRTAACGLQYIFMWLYTSN